MYDNLPDSKRLGIKYVIYLLLTLITLTATLTWGVVLFHWAFEHTYTLPANAPFGLTTERHGKIYWILFVTTVTRILLLSSSIARSANSYNRMFRYILILVAFLVVLAEVAALVIFIIERNSCNNAPDGDPSGRFNMCNDYRWCCVYATQNLTKICTTTSNLSFVEPSCPILLKPCEPQVFKDDLNDNWVFDTSFASTVIFIAIAILHIIIGGWMGDGSEASDYAAGYDDMESEIYKIDGPINNNSSNSYNEETMRKTRSKERKFIKKK